MSKHQIHGIERTACAGQNSQNQRLPAFPWWRWIFVLPPTMVSFIFLVSMDTPGYILTSEEDSNLGFTHKLKHVKYVLLGLSHLTQYNRFYFHPFTCRFLYFVFSLQLNRIPLCICTIFSPFLYHLEDR